MKAISLGIVIEGIRAKKDRSLGLTLSTPEMSVEEKTLMFELQGINCHATIQPLDDEFPEIVPVKGELDQKPLHVRLRWVLWVLATKMSGDEAEQYYKTQVEKWIEQAKEKIGEYENQR